MQIHEYLNRARAIIFDMDGVLIDSEPIHLLVERNIFDILNIRVSQSYHHTFVGRSSKEMWMDIRDKYKLEYTVEQLTGLKRDKYIEYLQRLETLPVIPGVQELLLQLKLLEKPMAVASSSAMQNIRYILERSGLDRYFIQIVSGNDLPRSKPDPAIFLQTAQLLGIHPKHCVVIEDSSAGILAAKSAGMTCLGYKGASYLGQDLSAADSVIESYYDLVI